VGGTGESSPSCRMVAITNLKENDDARIEPKEETVDWQLGTEGQNTRMGTNLALEMMKNIGDTLAKNQDLFTWSAEDMFGVDQRVMAHKLSVCKEAKPISQKKRRLG